MRRSAPLRVGIVAGESSGDQLGAALIAALRERVPELECFGVAGPKMMAAGCEAWAGAEELAVMGLTEVLPHLPRFLRLRAALIRRFVAEPPDVFVGIDAPTFNLGVARRLKERGIKTVQYVAPQVWAWRQGRARKIGRTCDLVLCLLPFETAFYARHGVQAVFVGHPLADQIPLEVDRAGARAALGLDPSARIVALLPGSRVGEVERLGADFLRAAAWLAARRPDLRFIAPMATARAREIFARMQTEVSTAPEVALLEGRAQQALAACDGAIVASGTATLETLLSRRPMVVAYRFGTLTAFVLRGLRLVKVPYFSQPNLLVGRALVPELLQEQVSGAALGEALLARLEDREYLRELDSEFRKVHATLRGDGAGRAADAIVALGRAAERPGRAA
ncbi:MAG: lipid-A-disaccharide synthase [Steroidobacteraceae bacterium]